MSQQESINAVVGGRRGTSHALEKQAHWDPEVVIVGAGIAGSALAAALGRDGRKVLLLERDLREPDRIVGEFLQPGGVSALDALGLSLSVSDIDAVPMKGYRVFEDLDEDVVLTYPKDKLGDAYEGRGLHHGRFVVGLRRAAMEESENVRVLQAVVKGLLWEGGRVVGVRFVGTGEKEKEVRAALTVVADGCFSNLRKELTSCKPVSKSHFVGFLVPDMTLPSPGHGHLVLANPSPVLVYPISSTETRVLIDVPGPRLPPAAQLKTHLLTHILPQVPDSLRQPISEALKTCKLRSMPNSYLPTTTTHSYEGVLLLGDSSNMRHPLTGGGMTVALLDVVELRQLLREVPDLSGSLAQVRKQWYSRRKRYAGVINVLAQALYALFSGQDARLIRLRSACFNYFKRGPTVTDELMGMLGGLLHQPATLTYHFFYVAYLACSDLLMDSPIYKLPLTLASTASVLYLAATIFLPLLLREQLQ